MPALTFNARAYAALSAFVSTDSTRYPMSGVRFEAHPTGDGVLAVSCCGHRMGIYYDDAGVIEAGPFILPAPKLAVAEARKAGDGERLTWRDGALSFERSPVRVDLAPIDGEYPQWRRVLPGVDAARRSPPDTASCFNSKYLADFHAAGAMLREGRGRSWGCGITVHLPSIAGGPSWVTLSGVPQFRGVIMPMRDDTPAEAYWLA